jgi:hypothetical protein
MITCVVHAVKTGRIFPWIYVIVFLPGIGSMIYFALEILPGLMSSRASRQLAAGVRAAADPNRDFREASRAAELVGSVDSRRALAEQHVARGNYSEAIAIYRSLLVGQFQDDPVLWQGLARAQFLAGDGAGAQASLDTLQKIDPKFVSADAHLLYARALELQGKDIEARDEYAKLIRYFPGEEARCRYAMLLQRLGDAAGARAIFQEIVKLLDGAPRHYRSAQREWGAIAKAALRQG